MPNYNAMDVDSRNGFPVRSNGAGPLCNNCGKQGHREKKCPEKRNGGRAQQGGKSPPPSYNQATENNHGNQQNGQGRAPCGFCSKTNHPTEKCFKNPNRQNDNNSNTNANANGKIFDQKKVDINGFAAEGYIFKDRLPQYTGSEAYCPICNRCDHNLGECRNLEGSSRLLFSPQCCWRCCFRGHTADECQNPQQQRCAGCHRTGHKSEECKNALLSAVNAGADRNAKRFVWHDSGDFSISPSHGQLEQAQLEQNLRAMSQQGVTVDPWELEQRRQQIAQMQVIQWPHQQVQPLPHIDLPNDLPQAAWQRPAAPAYARHITPAHVRHTTPIAVPAIPFQPSSTPQLDTSLTNIPTPLQRRLAATLRRIEEEDLSAHDRAVRAHIDRSAQLYRKQNYNIPILGLAARIEEQRILSKETHFALKSRIARGAHFWRDPKAMEALAKKYKPVCNSCGCDGHLLDRHMDSGCVYDDVKTVEDYEDWGVFVMFECRCCNYGFEYVPRLECDVMQIG